MQTTVTLTSRGHELDLQPSCFGPLTPSADIAHDPMALRERLARDGYLYLPGFFSREDIQAARTELLRRLATAGALDPYAPLDEAVAQGRPEMPHDALRANNPLLAEVVFAPRLLDFYSRLLGGKCRPYDHIWTRAIEPGPGTPPHCDFPYMNRGTDQVMTCWIPHGDVTLELGGLMMLEQSHQHEQRLRNYLQNDVDAYCVNRGPSRSRPGRLSDNPVTLREKLGGRWLTNSFRMGDLLTFGMKMVHASLDNRTASYRLSTDTRYQRADQPIDPRWVGEGTDENATRNRIGKIC